MANIKRVEAHGYCPFDFANAKGSRYDHKAHDAAMVYLGGLFLPAIGLNLEYGKEFYIPSKNGGRYSHYEFTITGEEAFGWEYFDELVKRFEAVGCRFTWFMVADVQWAADQPLTWDHIAIRQDSHFRELQKQRRAA
jgi:hypothetical protein